MTTKRSVLSRLKALVKAAQTGALKLEGGRKNWRVYTLDITELVWGRNLVDGWDIHVFMIDKRGYEDHIGTIEVDGNLNRTTLKDGDEVLATLNFSV